MNQSEALDSLKKDKEIVKFMKKYRYQYTVTMLPDLAKLVMYHQSALLNRIEAGLPIKYASGMVHPYYDGYNQALDEIRLLLQQERRKL